jgi:transposase
VEAVARLDDGDGISLPQLAKELDIDKSAAARRWQSARRRGYLKNEETRKGRPARLKIADPLPDDVEILPSVTRLAERCSVSGVQEGIPAPPPPADQDEVERLYRRAEEWGIA